MGRWTERWNKFFSPQPRIRLEFVNSVDASGGATRRSTTSNASPSPSRTTLYRYRSLSKSSSLSSEDELKIENNSGRNQSSTSSSSSPSAALKSTSERSSHPPHQLTVDRSEEWKFAEELMQSAGATLLPSQLGVASPSPSHDESVIVPSSSISSSSRLERPEIASQTVSSHDRSPIGSPARRRAPLVTSNSSNSGTSSLSTTTSRSSSAAPYGCSSIAELPRDDQSSMTSPTDCVSIRSYKSGEQLAELQDQDRTTSLLEDAAYVLDHHHKIPRRRWSSNLSMTMANCKPVRGPPPPSPTNFISRTTSPTTPLHSGISSLTSSKSEDYLRPDRLAHKGTLKTRRQRKVFGIGEEKDFSFTRNDQSDTPQEQPAESKRVERRNILLSPNAVSFEGRGRQLQERSPGPDETLESLDYFDERAGSPTFMAVKQNERLRRHSGDYGCYPSRQTTRYFAPIATEFPSCENRESPSAVQKLRRNATLPSNLLSRRRSFKSKPSSESGCSSASASPDLPQKSQRGQNVSFVDPLPWPSSPSSIASKRETSNSGRNGEAGSSTPSLSPALPNKMRRTQTRSRRRTQSNGSGVGNDHPHLPLLSARSSTRRSNTTSDIDVDNFSSPDMDVTSTDCWDPTPIVESVYVAKGWSIDTKFASRTMDEHPLSPHNDGIGGTSPEYKLQVANPDTDSLAEGETPLSSPDVSANQSPVLSTVPSLTTSSSDSSMSSPSPKSNLSVTPALSSPTALSYFSSSAPFRPRRFTLASKDESPNVPTTTTPPSYRLPSSKMDQYSHHHTIGIAV